MRLNTAVSSALLSALAFAGHGYAEDEAEQSSSSTSVNAERPTFTPTTLKAPFLEQFTDDWNKRWTPSHAKKHDTADDEEWAYVGNWEVEEPTVFPGIAGDKGLVVKNPAAHHAISAKFPKKIDNKGKTLVVQYEVKLQDSLNCGGAYMKLLQDNKKLQSDEFSNATPYVIMFGPDKCGATNKVHFIFNHKNPKTGQYEEKHLKTAPMARVSKVTTLYTLVVRPDQSFQILIDDEAVKNGTLFDDFSPPVNPPKEIEDPKDSKPDNWVDEAKIADPEAKKPEDWDEDAPYEIPDADATKPDDWLDNEPEMIPDPEAEKPEDWDDEEDGDWIAPKVPNPKCEEVSGCGTWERPMKENPDFKGTWSPPMIDNPAYKGPWAPRKIANPNYFEDKTPSNFEPIGGIGFEIWTMQSDILFDNIYIGHSVEDAKRLKAETFDIKHPIESVLEEAEKPKRDEQKTDTPEVSFKEDPVQYVRSKVDLFLSVVREDPVEAVKAVPEVAGGLGALLVTLILLIVGAVGLSTPAPAPATTKEEKKGKDKDKSKDETSADKDKGAEGSSSSTDKGKGGASKRTAQSG